MEVLEFPSEILIWVDLIFIISGLIIFLAIGVFILNAQGVGLSIRRSAKYIIFFAIFVCVASFSLHRYMKELPLRKAESLLSMKNDVDIYINGELKKIGPNVLRAFQDRRYIKMSGSSPTKYVYLVLKEKDVSLEFKLGQDSRDANLFWLYFPAYKWSSSLCYLKLNPELLR